MIIELNHLILMGKCFPELLMMEFNLRMARVSVSLWILLSQYCQYCHIFPSIIWIVMHVVSNVDRNILIENWYLMTVPRPQIRESEWKIDLTLIIIIIIDLVLNLIGMFRQLVTNGQRHLIAIYWTFSNLFFEFYYHYCYNFLGYTLETSLYCIDVQ